MSKKQYNKEKTCILSVYLLHEGRMKKHDFVGNRDFTFIDRDVRKFVSNFYPGCKIRNIEKRLNNA